MMKWEILVAASLFMGSGCAGMHKKVLREIHEGDSSDHVTQMLGEPDSFTPSQITPGAMVWMYEKGRDQCSIAIKDDKVIKTACIQHPSKAQKAIGAILMGASGSLANSNRVNCETTQSGSTVYTSCR